MLVHFPSCTSCALTCLRVPAEVAVLAAVTAGPGTQILPARLGPEQQRSEFYPGFNGTTQSQEAKISKRVHFSYR